MVALAFIGCVFKAFIGKRGLAVVRSFKAAKAGVVDDVKGVNGCNLRQRLIIYKLKGPLLLINSLISLFNYSVESFLWAVSYSTYSINLLFLLKTYTLLY